LQFGTGRFLQAHVDLFVSEALADGAAIGRIAVIQSTDSPASDRRLAAMAGGYRPRIEIRGLRGGLPVHETAVVDSIGAAWHAVRDWHRIVEAVADEVQVIVSNTADRGYELSPSDGADAIARDAPPPRSFPAKLLVLLHRRWSDADAAPLTLYPCELVQRNGDALRDVVSALARDWQLPADFIDYLRDGCVWVSSVVDRIVSAALEPAGAVAEPYALWAIEQRPRMTLPCRHPAVVLTNDLAKYERLKLMLLNLGHTYLAERWLQDRRPVDETVREAMNDAALCAELEAVWTEEVLPVFDALGEGEEARAYLTVVRDRFRNPFLAHPLADIAKNHDDKRRRRFVPVVRLAARQVPPIRQVRLERAIQGLI
jgi:tagaturonate reductase